MEFWDSRIEATAFGCFLPASVIDNPAHLDRVTTIFNWSQRWPNFNPYELRSKGNGDLRVHYETLDAMQRLRVLLKRALPVSSYYRDPAYNQEVRGAVHSYHLAGRAVDTPVLNTALGNMKLIHLGTLAGFTGFGAYGSFMHLDTGPHRVWIG